MVEIKVDLAGLQELLTFLGVGVTSTKLDAILTLLEQTMNPELQRLTDSVAAIKTVDDSIVALVTGLGQQIRDHANDPVALNALADSLDAEAKKVSDAVAANTPPPA